MSLKTKVEKLNSIFSAKMESYSGYVEHIADDIYTAWYNDNKIYVAGNGGSASQAEHLVAELIGRFKVNSEPIGAVSLTTNTSAITAIANDFSFNDIFSRQIDGLAVENDLVILFSTSGKSKNIVEAAKMANFIGCNVISFVGPYGEALLPYSDPIITIPSKDVDTIQEAHLLLTHAICEELETYRI